jgi:hypothetical protein
MKGFLESRVSAISIATDYRLNDQEVGVRALVGAGIFISPCRPDRLSGPPSLLSNGYGGVLSLSLMLPGREADHSLPTPAEVKKIWIYTSTPLYVFMV